VWMGAGTHAPQCPRGPPWQRAAATAWWKGGTTRRWVGEIEIENFTKKFVAWTRSAAQERQAHDQAHGATNLKASTTPVTGGEARRWNSGSGPG
jgi:hypothetical protein